MATLPVPWRHVCNEDTCSHTLINNKEVVSEAPDYYEKAYAGTPWYEWARAHGAIGAKGKPKSRSWPMGFQSKADEDSLREWLHEGNEELRNGD